MKKALLIVFLFGVLTACTPAVTPIPMATFTISPPTSTPKMESTPVPASPMPTQPIILMITPDLIQVERWREYQTALAKSLLSHLPPKEVLCEWEILSQVDHKVYVWAVCKSGIESSSTPVVIHLETDGSILSVEVPEPGLSDYPKLFPTDVQEKFTYYRYGRAKEMSDHIDWRWTHIDEPPLIVLSATPTP